MWLVNGRWAASGLGGEESWKGSLDYKKVSIISECGQPQFPDRTHDEHVDIREYGLVVQWHSSPIHFVCNFIQPAENESGDTQSAQGIIKRKGKIKFLTKMFLSVFIMEILIVQTWNTALLSILSISLFRIHIEIRMCFKKTCIMVRSPTDHTLGPSGKLGMNTYKILLTRHH